MRRWNPPRSGHRTPNGTLPSVRVTSSPTTADLPHLRCEKKLTFRLHRITLAALHVVLDVDPVEPEIHFRACGRCPRSAVMATEVARAQDSVLFRGVWPENGRFRRDAK